MNKLTALSKLANAYYYLFLTEASNEALEVLSATFHRVRRSMTLLDLAPKQDTEDYNGRMPTQL